MLKAYPMEEARERTIRRAVVGGRFCAVVLDNGSAVAVNICSDACGEPSLRQSGSPPTLDWLPRAGTPAGSTRDFRAGEAKVNVRIDATWTPGALLVESKLRASAGTPP